jgi:hypothetical protein
LKDRNPISTIKKTVRNIEKLRRETKGSFPMGKAFEISVYMDQKLKFWK